MNDVAYRDEVKKVVKHASLGDRKGVGACINACFSLKTSLDRLSQALVILDELFRYSVTNFISKHNLSVEEATSVVSELLYGLYDLGIDPRQGGEYLLIQTIGALGFQKTASDILNKLSDDETVGLISFLFSHPNEGTYRLLDLFHDRYKPLIHGLRTYYYDVKQLQNTSHTLEIHAENEAKELHAAMTKLVATIQSSLRELLGKDERSEEQLKQFLASFASFDEGAYTQADFLEFARIFGLSAYPPIYPEGYTENDRLLQKVLDITKIVEQQAWPLFLLPQDTQSILSFVFAVIDHLEATLRRPSKYKLGLDLLTCTIATCGKELESLSSLQSLVEGYRVLREFLDKKGGIKIALKDYPIVVFDQSEKALFAKNKVYVERLNLRYQANIIHVSRAEAEEFAKSLGIWGLVVTKPDGTFGFGGARNCQFMLTAKACKNNDPKAVFGDPENKIPGKALFLVDDDMLIPESNLFTAALFAFATKNQPLSAVGYQFGRASKFHIHFWSLKEVLEGPIERNMFPQWLDYPTLAGLSEHVLRPKFCLNLPHGNEESHSLSIAKGHFFLKPSQHISGSRYPTKLIPTKFYVGLPGYLEKMNSYSLLIYLADYFINAKGTRGTPVLPWNDNLSGAKVSSLAESMNNASHELIKRELQARFWQRVEGFFHLELVGYRPFLRIIEELKGTDIAAACKEYERQNQLTAYEKEALERLAKVYTTLQKDAKLFWKFGTLLAQSPEPAQELEKIKEQLEFEDKVKFSEFPLTEGFYLMTRALGKGQFCDLLAKATVATLESL